MGGFGSATPKDTFSEAINKLRHMGSSPSLSSSCNSSGKVNISRAIRSGVWKNSGIQWACGNSSLGRTMIATCANPACSIPFLYFRSGRIFILEAADIDPRSGADHPIRRIEYFWLCGKCSSTLRPMRTADGTVAIGPLPVPPEPMTALKIVFSREIKSSKSEDREWLGNSA